MAELRVGTSGYNYKEWKGTFYPAKLPDREMLRFYAGELPTVEINYTFYRMPNEKTLQNWAGLVPPGFRFALKANQKITHVQKLKGCEDALAYFLQAASVLAQGEHLGPILFQLPPSYRVDPEVLARFLELRPRAFRFALEVRHPSWHDEKIYSLLRRHQTALCLAETDQETPPEVLTADFAYVRLRRTDYTAGQLASWRKKFQGWLRAGVDVYAYCKHEEAGKGAAYARRLLA